MNFQCSWDTNVFIITLLFVVALLGAIAFLVVKAVRYKREGQILTVCLLALGIVFFLGVLIVSGLECPLKVSVDKETVRIHRMIGNVVIPIETIEEIRLYKDSDTAANVRKWGSGGVFGYLGKFSNPQLGDYQMYVTNASKKILVKTSDKIIVFSCNQPEELIAAAGNP
jgi:hypothetical protein